MIGKTPLECHASRMHLNPETHGKTHRLPVAVFLGFQLEFQTQNTSKPSHNTSILHLWTQTCQNTLQYITYSPILIKLQLNTSKTQFQERFGTKYNHTPSEFAQTMYNSYSITLEVIWYLKQQHLNTSTHSKSFFNLKLLKFLIVNMKTWLKTWLKSSKSSLF